jgi:hypothetical protein
MAAYAHKRREKTSEILFRQPSALYLVHMSRCPALIWSINWSSLVLSIPMQNEAMLNLAPELLCTKIMPRADALRRRPSLSTSTQRPAQRAATIRGEQTTGNILYNFNHPISTYFILPRLEVSHATGAKNSHIFGCPRLHSSTQTGAMHGARNSTLVWSRMSC